MGVHEIVIDRRFNGPEASANGGYAAGLVARLLAAEAAEVRLLRPPPLGRPLGWDGARLLDADAALAEGTAVAAATADPPADLPDPVAFAAAEAASREFPGFIEHEYATCFGCGTARAPGDGLRLFPGPVPGREVVAAPWVPDASLLVDGEVPAEVLWAALDCGGGWAGLPHHEGTYVLGTMRAAVTAEAEVGTPHVVTGWQRGAEGRKLLCASALRTASGDLLGWSEQTWVRLSP